MAFSLDSIFTTVTAVPSVTAVITEIEPPPVLKPYIRCFWTCGHGKSDVALRIIPDCCADIIFDIDNSSAQFVGVSSGSFISGSTGAFFGIRFYAWAVRSFVNGGMPVLFNNSADPETLFCKFKPFKNAVIEAKSTKRRTELAQAYLLNLLGGTPDADVMNCLYAAIKHGGNISTDDMRNYAVVGRRTLERKFAQSIGIPPKSTIDLLRYQLLWQDCIANDFSALDAVDKFGYYDQSHMYNDFKKYHGISLNEARREYRKLSQIYNTNI